MLLLFMTTLLSCSMQTKADQVSRNPLATLDEAALKGFVERPLFEPSRHRSALAAPLAKAAPLPALVVEQPPSLRLLGLVEGANSSAAVVRRNDIGKTDTLRSGDRIGNWIVQILLATLQVKSGNRVDNYALFHKAQPEGPLP